MNLQAQTRLSRICRKLKTEMDKKSVIALQEVSLEWAGELHAFFASQQYYFVTGLYGRKFDGRMGVGIAFPMTEFTLAGSDIHCLSDNDDVGLGKRRFMATYWKEAADRINQAVSVRLRHKGSGNSFVVSTYHMPCLFRMPKTMLIHSALLLRHVQSLAQGDPYAILGDFNSPPSSPIYRYVTCGAEAVAAEIKEMNSLTIVESPAAAVQTGSSAFFLDTSNGVPSAGAACQIATGSTNVDEGAAADVIANATNAADAAAVRSDKEIVAPLTPDAMASRVTASVPDFPWDIVPLRSAYAVFNGAEPDFTNYAQVRDDPPFIGTLDYIFLSPHWNVKNVRHLEIRQNVRGPLPTAVEPSDHVLISATVSTTHRSLSAVSTAEVESRHSVRTMSSSATGGSTASFQQ